MGNPPAFLISPRCMGARIVSENSYQLRQYSTEFNRSDVPRVVTGVRTPAPYRLINFSFFFVCKTGSRTSKIAPTLRRNSPFENKIFKHSWRGLYVFQLNLPHSEMLRTLQPRCQPGLTCAQFGWRLQICRHFVFTDITFWRRYTVSHSLTDAVILSRCF